MGKGIFIRIFGVFSICALFASSTVVADDAPDCGSGWWWTKLNYCEKCPDGFNLSKPNSRLITNCYKVVYNTGMLGYGTTTVYYSQKQCSPGKYLPKNTAECVNCKVGYWCPGGVFDFDSTKDQGINKCPQNYTSNEKAVSPKKCYKKNDSTVPFKGCISGQYLLYTCTPCPEGYDKSDTDATNQNQCYKQQGNEKIYFAHTVCPAGQYLPTPLSNCADCPTDLFCPGGQFLVKQSKDQGVKKCPVGYFASDDNTKCIEGCPAGQYMPKGKNECEKCLDGYWCKGGNNEPMICSDNLVPNEDQTGCTEYDTGCEDGKYYDGNTCQQCPAEFKKTDEPGTSITNCYAELSGGGVLYYDQQKCDVGKYMPKNTSVCDQPCKPNHKCPGGQYYTSTQKDSGITKCGANETNNDDYSKCVSTLPSGGTAECKVGEYLPKNEGRCKLCTNQHKYCPGGKYEYYKSTDQGIFDCPANAVANLNHDKCTFNLSQTFMKRGPSGTTKAFSEQCWTKSTLQSYAKCLFTDE